MGRIAGHFEWDDDDLTPGNKREGGLHQNLFDSDGKLRGSARFVPGESDPIVVTETIYVPAEERRRSDARDELDEAIARIVGHLIDQGIARAKPVVAHWWHESAKPALDARREAFRDARTSLKARRLHKGLDTKPHAGESSRAMASTEGKSRQKMSLSEAQARYLAAAAARAFSDEQLRLVNEADIIDVVGIAELEMSIRELPPEQLRALIEAMVNDPSMLSEQTLASLSSILGRREL